MRQKYKIDFDMVPLSEMELSRKFKSVEWMYVLRVMCGCTIVQYEVLWSECIPNGVVKSRTTWNDALRKACYILVGPRATTNLKLVVGLEE